MKIVVLDGYTENPGDLSWEGLEALGELTVYDRTAPEDVIARIGDAPIVFTNKTVVGEEVFKACPAIKYIGVLATGTNVVDLKAAKEHGIAVTNIPTYGTDAVAQFTMALILELCHRIGDHSNSVKTGAWASNPDFCFWNYPLTELAGKTLGIIGFGRIGSSVARKALSFDMKVVAYGNHGIPEERLLPGVESVSLEELLERSDIISLHCPLTDSNKGLIGKENIARMKKGVWIINTARGPLINEAELKEALENGSVGAAAVDVVSKEPIENSNPLLTAPNTLITPHIAWAPVEARARLMNIAVDNLAAFLMGEPVNVVNK